MYSSCDIVRIKDEVGGVYTTHGRNTYIHTILLPEGADYMGDVGMYGSIILKWVLHLRLSAGLN
jgi:calcineurin-like phosphoesterase